MPRIVMRGIFLYSGFMKKFLPYSYFAIFLVPLLINPWGFQMYGAVKSAWVLLILALFFAWSLWQVFTAVKIKVKYNKSLIFYLALWFISLCLSSAFAGAPVRSIFGEYLYMQGVLFFVFLFLHFFVCWQLFAKKGSARIFFNLLKIVALIISVHSIGQYFNIDPFVDVDNAEYLFRVYGTVGQPNFLAQWLIFPLIIAAFDFWNLLKKRGLKALLLNGLLLALILITVYLTKNRATWLALFSGFYLWLFAFSGLKLRQKGFIAGAGLIAVIVALFGLGVDFRSLNSRGFLWNGVFSSLDFANLWLGHGMASFKDVFVQLMPKEVFLFEKFYTIPGSPHSEFLQVLIERGLFGLVIYGFSIFFLLRLVWQKKIKSELGMITFMAIAVYLISIQFSFSTVEHWVVLAAFWAILLIDQLKFKTRTIQFIYAFDRILIGSLLAIVLMISFFFSFSIFKSDLLMNRAVERFLYSDQKAYELFDQAIDIMPFWTYPREMAVNLTTNFAKDESFLQRHVEKIGMISGDDYNYHVLAIKVAGRTGKIEEVADHYQLARELAPNAPIVYTEVANAYFKAGDCEKALEAYDILEGLVPVFEDSEKLRLFRKHASQFIQAMANKGECLN